MQEAFSFDARTFSPQVSQALKDSGMKAAADSKKAVLDTAQQIARSLARLHGQVDADMVQAELLQVGITPEDLGNAAGSIFKGKDWRCVGSKPSIRASRHGNAIRIWELVNG